MGSRTIHEIEEDIRQLPLCDMEILAGAMIEIMDEKLQERIQPEKRSKVEVLIGKLVNIFPARMLAARGGGR